MPLVEPPCLLRPIYDLEQMAERILHHQNLNPSNLGIPCAKVLRTLGYRKLGANNGRFLPLQIEYTYPRYPNLHEGVTLVYPALDPIPELCLRVEFTAFGWGCKEVGYYYGAKALAPKGVVLDILIDRLALAIKPTSCLELVLEDMGLAPQETTSI